MVLTEQPKPNEPNIATQVLKRTTGVTEECSVSCIALPSPISSATGSGSRITEGLASSPSSKLSDLSMSCFLLRKKFVRNMTMEQKKLK